MVTVMNGKTPQKVAITLGITSFSSPSPIFTNASPWTRCCQASDLNIGHVIVTVNRKVLPHKYQTSGGKISVILAVLLKVAAKTGRLGFTDCHL